MPYFVFKYKNKRFKTADHLQTFNSFKGAKLFVTKLREEQSLENVKDPSIFKIVFAEDVIEAEFLALEKRDAPILREWEK